MVWAIASEVAGTAFTSSEVYDSATNSQDGGPAGVDAYIQASTGNCFLAKLPIAMCHSAEYASYVQKHKLVGFGKLRQLSG